MYTKRADSVLLSTDSGKQVQILAGFFPVLTSAISSEEISTIFKILNVFTVQRGYSGLYLMCGFGYTILTNTFESALSKKKKGCLQL